MSKLSELFRERKINNLKYFFGNDANISKDGEVIINYNHVIDNDNIIIQTNNIKYWINKDQWVLVVAKNKAVYLKEWQIREIKNWNKGIDSYAVKLNRKYFKIYNLSYEFGDISSELNDDFDSLLEIAKLQNNNQISWKLGHYNFTEEEKKEI